MKFTVWQNMCLWTCFFWLINQMSCFRSCIGHASLKTSSGRYTLKVIISHIVFYLIGKWQHNSHFSSLTKQTSNYGSTEQRTSTGCIFTHRDIDLIYSQFILNTHTNKHPWSVVCMEETCSLCSRSKQTYTERQRSNKVHLIVCPKSGRVAVGVFPGRM